MRDTIAMGREAGIKHSVCEFYNEELKRFADLVRADEREACAYRAGIALLGADRGLANRVDQAIRAKGQA
jgi:hypothetical protein